MYHNQFAAKDFSAKTLAALKKRQLQLKGTTYLPDYSKPLPFANAPVGYTVCDEVYGRSEIRTFAQVLELAAMTFVTEVSK